MKKVKAFFYLVTLICTWAYISLIRIIGYSFSQIDLSANIKSPNLVLVNLTNILLCVLVLFVVAVVNYWSFELINFFKLKEIEKMTESILGKVSEFGNVIQEKKDTKESAETRINVPFQEDLLPLMDNYAYVDALFASTKDSKISFRILYNSSKWKMFNGEFLEIGIEAVNDPEKSINKILVDCYGRIFTGNSSNVNNFTLFYWPTIELLVSSAKLKYEDKH